MIEVCIQACCFFHHPRHRHRNARDPAAGRSDIDHFYTVLRGGAFSVSDYQRDIVARGSKRAAFFMEYARVEARMDRC